MREGQERRKTCDEKEEGSTIFGKEKNLKIIAK